MLITLQQLKTSLQAVKNYIDNLLPRKVSDLQNDIGFGTYSKPNDGIPKADLSFEVQTSLGKADTALQSAPVTSVNNKTGDVELSASDVGALPDDTVIPTVPTNVSAFTNDAGYGTYSKPSGGIPKSDLASAVQTSLGKADSALQSYTETDPTVPSWAKQSSKPSYTAQEVGALPSSTVIPTKTSDLQNDSGFITSAPVTSVNNKTGAVTLTASDVGAGTYSKPSGGIPASDLANAVQTSLGKADTALQTAPTPDWNAVSGADGYIDNKPNIRQGADTNHTAVAEGSGTASAFYSHAEGSATASANYAHGEGYYTTASGSYSHAEGDNTTAFGSSAHAEGHATQAQSYYSHAEGDSTTATTSAACHAEGASTTASGYASHAEGGTTTASNYFSHAEGYSTEASAAISHAEGWGTVAQSTYQHVQGKYNIVDYNSSFAHIVGGGTSSNNRVNIHTLDWNGNAYYSGKLTVGSAPTNNMDVATKQYVDNSVVQEIFVGSTTPSGYILYIDPEGSIPSAQGVSF